MTGQTSMPVLPARVKTWGDTAGWAEVSADKPAIYLVGDVLNAGRVTPEYEMLPNADYTEYTIEHFAMRNCTVKALAYSGQDSSPVSIGEQTVNPFTGSDFASATMTPGVDYRAVCRKDNDGNWTLTLEANSQDDPNAKNLPPFLSMVGYNFRQADNEVTPNAYGYNNLKYTSIDAESDTGWQESWLQQDAEGNLLRDKNGRVMYNTMWPPKNQIFFNAVKTHTDNGTEVIVEELEINSDNLTFVPYRVDGKVVIKKGSDWKTYLDGTNTESDYYKLFNTADDADNSWVKSMDDNYYYARYVVPNVWILGASKIWTGWTGRIISGTDWAGADWSAHSQWGYQEETANDGGTTIATNTPYYMKKDKGNFMFDAATYFKSVEFFYCLGSDLGSNHDDTTAIFNNSLLYTIRSKGEPSIQARAYNNEDGNYKMELGAELSQDVKVTGIVIRRYSATQSTTDEWVPVTKANVACTEENAVVKTWSDQTLDKSGFNTSFSEWDTTDLADANLAEGKYFYGMTLTFSDGTTEKNVKSNPFTIVKADVETNPEVYQLCELAQPDNGYQYVTYAPAATKAYLVKKTETSDGAKVEYKETTVPTVSEYLDGTIMKWTDRMFVREDVPAKFTAGNAKYDIDNITGYTLKISDTEVTPEAGGMDADTKGYAAVLKTSFARDINVKLSLAYTVETDDEGEDPSFESTPVTKTFTYTFPVPTFGAPEVKVSADASANSISAPYADSSVYSISGNVHSLEVKVPVLAPNIADGVSLSATTTVTADSQTISSGSVTADTDLVFSNQDPNQWIKTADGTYDPIEHTVSLSTTEYSNCDQYPTEPGYTSKSLTVDKTITTLALSDVNLVNAIVRCDGDGNIDPSSDANNYRAVLAVSEAGISGDSDVISGTTLAHASSSYDDNSYYAFKAGTETLELKASSETGFHRHSDFYNSSKYAIIAMSDPFHWYAEMDEELFNVEDYKIAIARAYFFTGENSGVTFGGGTSSQNLLYAASADATHYTFLAPFSEYALKETDIITSVDGISVESAVKAGKGWIEVNGRGVAVYSADGMCVANGPGRFNVASGVYVVRADGKNYKVVVK